MYCNRVGPIPLNGLRLAGWTPAQMQQQGLFFPWHNTKYSCCAMCIACIELPFCSLGGVVKGW